GSGVGLLHHDAHLLHRPPRGGGRSPPLATAQAADPQPLAIATNAFPPLVLLPQPADEPRSPACPGAVRSPSVCCAGGPLQLVAWLRFGICMPDQPRGGGR